MTLCGSLGEICQHLRRRATWNTYQKTVIFIATAMRTSRLMSLMHWVWVQISVRVISFALILSLFSLVIFLRTPQSNFLYVHCQITIVSRMNYHFCYKFQWPRSMKRKSTYQNAPAFPLWTVTDILGSLDTITISATVMWNQRMRDDLLWWTLQTKNRFCRRWMDGRSITSVHKWKIL